MDHHNRSGSRMACAAALLQRMRRWRGIIGLLSVGLALVPAPPVSGATPLEQVAVSPDTWVDFNGTVLPDHNVGFDDLSGSVTAGICAPNCFPDPSDADAYDIVTATQVLASPDIAIELPASGGGTVVLFPGDIGLLDRVASGWSIAFDASVEGVPASVNTDAVALASPGSAASLLLSFDIPVELGGNTYKDEDLVLWNGASFSIVFDGSARGVAEGLDLDAAYRIAPNDHLLLSFDGSGTLGGVAFEDEDLLEFDPVGGTWEMAYDGSGQHAGWVGANLDAAAAILVAAPPAIPDGSGGDSPFRVSKAAGAPVTLDLTWEAASCSQQDVHLLYGSLATVSSYAISGSECDLGTGGSATVTVPMGSLWVLVVANDDDLVEGSWGQATAGERNGTTASAECGISARDNSGTCP